MSRLSVVKNKLTSKYYKSKDKIKDHFATSTEQTFNWIYFLGSMILSAFAFYFGLTYLQIISVSLLRVAIYFLSLSGFIKFLYSIKYNVLEEVFVKGNTAAGIFLAGLAVGLPIVIAVAV